MTPAVERAKQVLDESGKAVEEGKREQKRISERLVESDKVAEQDRKVLKRAGYLAK